MKRATVVVNGRKQDAVDEAVAKLQAKGYKARGGCSTWPTKRPWSPPSQKLDQDSVEVDILINNAGIQCPQADGRTGAQGLAAGHRHQPQRGLPCRARSGQATIARGARRQIINIGPLTSEAARADGGA